VPVASFDTVNAEQTLSAGIQDDILSAYIRRVENNLGVTVNEAAIRSITGADKY
jgi:hypothetical protein